MTPIKLEVGRTYLDRCGYPRIVSREVPPDEARRAGKLACRWFEVRFTTRGVLENHDSGGFVSRDTDDGWRMENGRADWHAEDPHDLVETADGVDAAGKTVDGGM